MKSNNVKFGIDLLKSGWLDITALNESEVQ